MKTRIAICAVLATVVFIILIGSYTVNIADILKIKYNYRDMLFEPEYFYKANVVGMWMMFAGALLAMLLVWIKQKWAPIVGMVLCFVPVVFHFMEGIWIPKYNPFEFGFWHVVILIGFVVAGILCISLTCDDEAFASKKAVDDTEAK